MIGCDRNAVGDGDLQAFCYLYNSDRKVSLAQSKSARGWSDRYRPWAYNNNFDRPVYLIFIVKKNLRLGERTAPSQPKLHFTAFSDLTTLEIPRGLQCSSIVVPE